MRVVLREALEEEHILSNTTITEVVDTLTEVEGAEVEEEATSIKEEVEIWDRVDCHTQTKARTLVSSHPSKDIIPCNNHPWAVWE